MLDRQGMGAAAGAASLGTVADNALIAVVRHLSGTMLSEDDRAALQSALDILQVMNELGAPRIVPAAGPRAMASVTLDETFRAIANARDVQPDEDLATELARLRSAIEDVLSGTAKPEVAEGLRAFLDRLGAITLARSEEVARPGRDQRAKWIREALGS